MSVNERVAAALVAMLAVVGAQDSTVNAGQVSGAGLPVAALVNGQPVLETTLDDWVSQHEAATYQRLRRETYESRRRALDALLADRLLTAEADRRGMARAQLIEIEAARRTRPVTEADVALFLAGSTLPPGVTAEMVSPTVTSLLQQRAVAAAREEYVASLRAAPASAVQVFLAPPRVPGLRDAHNPTRGRRDAPVEVVVFSDFECPFCRRAEPALARLVTRFPEDVRLVWKHFPLSIHANARAAAEASQCAHAQGRFWAFHDRLFADADVARLLPERLVATAVDLGLDGPVFEQCMRVRTHEDQVAKDSADGERAGVSGTPTVFINGVAIVGSQPYEVYERAVVEELARTSTPRPRVGSGPAATEGRDR